MKLIIEQKGSSVNCKQYKLIWFTINTTDDVIIL